MISTKKVNIVYTSLSRNELVFKHFKHGYQNGRNRLLGYKEY